MKNKSVAEFIRVTVLDMVRKLKAQRRFDQFQQSKHHRSKMSLVLADVFGDLPYDKAKEIMREQTKSTMIDQSDIVDQGNEIFNVASTTTHDETRTVNMVDITCTCIPFKEDKIVCRHLFAVTEHFGEQYGYVIEQMDFDHIIGQYKIEIDNTKTQSNDNSAENNDVDIDSNSNNNSNDTSARLPIPQTNMKKNLKSARQILGQLKTLTSLVYACHMQTDTYTEFRQSSQDSEVSFQLQEYVFISRYTYILSIFAILFAFIADVFK